MLGHPYLLFIEPVKQNQKIVSPVSTEYRHEAAVTPAWLRLLSALLYPLNRLVFLAGLLMGTVLCLRRMRSEGFALWWSVPIVLVITAVPLSVLAWHADSIETERHALQIATQLRIAMWIFMAIGLEPVVHRLTVSPVGQQYGTELT